MTRGRTILTVLLACVPLGLVSAAAPAQDTAPKKDAPKKVKDEKEGE